MAFRIRFGSLAVSTRTCTSYHTRANTRHCRWARFLFFAWEWLNPDLFTLATCSLAVMSLASLCCLASQHFFRYCASLWPFHSQLEQKPSFLRPSSCKELTTGALFCSGWAKIEDIGGLRVGKDGVGSRSRLGRNFFAGATRSSFVSSMLYCLRIFCFISSSNL